MHRLGPMGRFEPVCARRVRADWSGLSGSGVCPGESRRVKALTPRVVTPTAGLTGMMVTARVGDSGWPRGEASFSAPQAKKILGPERRFSENMSDFEWKSPAPTMPISRGKLTAYLAPPTEDLSLPAPGGYWVLNNVEECYFIPS